MLRKLKLLLPLFLFFGTIATAQQVYIVPQIGLNVNTYNFDETSSNIGDQRFSPGVSAGVGFNIALNEMRTFIIQPEINYSLRSNRTDNLFPTSNQQGSETITLNQRNTMHYMEIPVLARLDFGIDTRYYINIGPSFSYALSGKEKLESNIPAIESYNRKADFDTRFNRTDWSAIIGGGVEFPFNDGFLVLDARFAWGFKTLYKTREVQGIGEDGNPTTLTVAPEGKNRMFTLSIGYGLPLN